MLTLLLLGATPAQAASREAALAQCADCHPSVCESYARSGMARALERVPPGELARLAPLPEPATGFVYSFEEGRGGARVVEGFSVPAGAPPWRDSAPVAFAVGAGELDRSYVVTRFARWWLAPLEVVGHAGGTGRHTAFAPGHAMAPGTRFGQPVTPECLGCHTDAPPPRSWPLNQAVGEWEPRGLSCGACHGAIEEHVRVRAAELAGEGRGADPLAAERSWSRRTRMERCAACHLQGDARIELDPFRRGPPPPGTPLLATRAVFVAREASDEIGFVSQVERLVLSRCYLASASFADGGLTCETCHDPHRSAFEPEERRATRAACTRCHETPDAPPRAAACSLAPPERPAGRDCVACHVRETGVFDVAEVRIHDHWIARTPGGPSAVRALRFPASPSGDWRVFAWPEAGASEEEDAGLWALALAHGGLDERARAALAKGPGARTRALPMFHHVRGSLLERAGELSAARAAYEEALRLDPELAEAKVNLGPLLARLGDVRAGRAILDELIATHPLADGAYRNRALVRLAAGDEPGFRADLETAMKLMPEAGLAQALARHAEERGDAAGKQRWSEEARRLDPRLR